MTANRSNPLTFRVMEEYVFTICVVVHAQVKAFVSAAASLLISLKHTHTHTKHTHIFFICLCCVTVSL